MKKNDVFSLLACSLGENSDEPNIRLASSLCLSRNEDAVGTLINGLFSPDKAIAGDCIKVLYELGRLSPDMIADYSNDFVKLLSSKNNRLVWGAMTALAQIAPLNPHDLFAHRDEIIRAYETGSVITRDESVSVFAAISRADMKYERVMFPLILKHLETCRPKEIPQHAERAFPAVNKKNASSFEKVLMKRADLLTEPQKKRIDKLLRAVREM